MCRYCMCHSRQRFWCTCFGTMAHSWVQLFPSELEAFRAYARVYPDNCVLLVDTYNVLKSGCPTPLRYLKKKLCQEGSDPRESELIRGYCVSFGLFPLHRARWLQGKIVPVGVGDVKSILGIVAQIGFCHCIKFFAAFKHLLA